MPNSRPQSELDQAYKFGLNISILSVRPLVLFASAIELEKEIEWFPCAEFGASVLAAVNECVSVPCHFALKLSWSAIDAKRVWELNAKKIRTYLNCYPSSKVTIFANTVDEQDYIRGLGLECIFVNHNALINEEIFDIVPDIAKEFDAVYIGKLHALKRHYLAKEVKSLLLTYSPWGENQQAYFESLLTMLPHAKFLNGDFSNVRPELGPYKYLESRQIALALNRSRVGLCLSKIEGAMNASTEYMLCGLPVVSTQSRGGREVMFDDNHCLIVDDDASAVAAAVNELILRRVDPRAVRNATLMKMAPHRDRMRQFLAHLQQENNAEVTFEKDMQRLRKYWGLLKFREIQDISVELRQLLSA